VSKRSRHEADDLAHRVASGDHHQEAEQDDGEREGDVLARQHVGPRRHRHGDEDGERGEP
jgi:hypothetical protein